MPVSSTGGAIAFALEAFERGLLSPADTGGLALTWGDPRVMLTLVRQIGLREGIGKLLGEGVREAARQIGRGAEDFALHVRGLELAQHEWDRMKANDSQECRNWTSRRPVPAIGCP